MGFVKDALDWGWKNKGTIAQIGATAYGAYQGSKAQGKANDLDARRIAMEERAYNEAAPLRKAGMEGMLRGGHEYDLTDVSYDQTNPFARRATLPQRAPAPASSTGPAMTGQPMQQVPNPLTHGNQDPYSQMPETDPATQGLRWNPETGRYEAINPFTGPTIYPKRGGG